MSLPSHAGPAPIATLLAVRMRTVAVGANVGGQVTRERDVDADSMVQVRVAQRRAGTAGWNVWRQPSARRAASTNDVPRDPSRRRVVRFGGDDPTTSFPVSVDQLRERDGRRLDAARRGGLRRRAPAEASTTLTLAIYDSSFRVQGLGLDPAAPIGASLAQGESATVGHRAVVAVRADDPATVGADAVSFRHRNDRSGWSPAPTRRAPRPHRHARCSAARRPTNRP